MAGKTIEITADKARKAFKDADKGGKTLLKNLLGEEIFSDKIQDRVKTFDDVLAEAGITMDEFENSCSGLSVDEIAYRKIKLITKVLNEDWVPDWSNSNQGKYYPWFKYSGSGFGFANFGYGYDGTNADLGSRLVFKSSDLARYAGETFTDIYNSFLV